mgnify:CR=1 FL=1
MKKKMPRILLFSGIVLAVIILGLFAAIKYSSPVSPAPDGKIAAVFRAADYSHLPSLSYYQARDGVKLAYRSYPSGAASLKTVVLIHGSTGSSMMMHPLAKYLQGQGIHVYAPDMRGHGSSGEKGDIAYIGQLEDDLGQQFGVGLRLLFKLGQQRRPPDPEVVIVRPLDQPGLELPVAADQVAD